MAEKKITLKNVSGDILYPKTLAAVVINNSQADLGDVEAGAQVNKIEQIEVDGQILPITEKKVTITSKAAPEYLLHKLDATEDAEKGYDATYAAQYTLTKDGAAVGDIVNIPKDQVLKAVALKQATEVDTPLEGLAVDDYYFEFTFDNKTTPIYLSAKPLSNIFTAGAGLTLTAGAFAVNTTDTAVVDTVVTASSTKLIQSGAVSTAIEAAKTEFTGKLAGYVEKASTGEAGTSLIFNEADGGGMRFTRTDGSGSLIAINDGTDDVYAQVSAHTKDKARIARLNVQPTGIFYTKDAADNTVTADNEIITKAEVDAVSKEVQSVKEEIGKIEAGTIGIDQTYNAESEHAQSGKAVAEAVADLATKTELTAHTGNTEIHVTAEKTAEWDAKVDTAALEAAKTELQGAIDAKVESVLHYKGQVASVSALPEADQATGDVYNVEDTGANYAWDGTQWDKLSEDLSGFASGADLTAHTSNSDIHVTAKEKTGWSDKYTKSEVDAAITAAKPTVDQTYDEASENAQSGTAVKEAIATKADATALTAHTGDTDIHTSAEEKTGFADKYTKAEIDAKLANVITYELLEEEDIEPSS